MISLALMLQEIEFFLGFSRDRVPVVKTRTQLSMVKWRKNELSVREKKGVSNIEEDCF